MYSLHRKQGVYFMKFYHKFVYTCTVVIKKIQISQIKLQAGHKKVLLKINNTKYFYDNLF